MTPWTAENINGNSVISLPVEFAVGSKLTDKEPLDSNMCWHVGADLIVHTMFTNINERELTS